MDQDKFDAILKRYLAGIATVEEKQIVDSWYDGMGGKSLDLIDDSEENELEKYYWTSISENMRKAAPAGKIRKIENTNGRFIKYSMGIAASVGTIAALFFYFLVYQKGNGHNRLGGNGERGYHSQEKIVNTKNTLQRYVLSDGTKITLDPESSIEIATDFNKSSRDIELVGKAFFEVAHNPQKPFRVFANGVTTKVLGTSFIIKAYKNDQDVMVSVRSGRVSIYSNEMDTNKTPETILTPNHQIVYNKAKKTIAKGLVKVPEPLIKVEEIQRLRFEAAPATEIFQAMEKIYGVDIVFDEATFSSCKLTTSLANGGLYERLGIVTSAIGATYSINENVIVISGAGCD